jgi:hypothetical protein
LPEGFLERGPSRFLKSALEILEKRQIIISTALIRRGGAPSGAAAPVVMGVWGHQPPSHISWRDLTGKWDHFFILYTCGFPGIMSGSMENYLQGPDAPKVLFRR